MDVISSYGSKLKYFHSRCSIPYSSRLYRPVWPSYRSSSYFYWVKFALKPTVNPTYVYLILIPLNLGIISTSSASADALEEGPGYVECVIWCAAHHFRLDECAIPALHRKGPCYECGPCKTAASKKLCDKKCVDTSNDTSNCGVCGNKVCN